MATGEQRALTRANVAAAYKIIAPSIHKTPVLTNTTLSTLASTPQDVSALKGTPWEGQEPAAPKINLYFKVRTSNARW
jgi:threonine dehydratase